MNPHFWSNHIINSQTINRLSLQFQRLNRKMSWILAQDWWSEYNREVQQGSSNERAVTQESRHGLMQYCERKTWESNSCKQTSLQPWTWLPQCVQYLIPWLTSGLIQGYILLWWLDLKICPHKTSVSEVRLFVFPELQPSCTVVRFIVTVKTIDLSLASCTYSYWHRTEKLAIWVLLFFNSVKLTTVLPSSSFLVQVTRRISKEMWKKKGNCGFLSWNGWKGKRKRKRTTYPSHVNLSQAEFLLILWPKGRCIWNLEKDFLNQPHFLITQPYCWFINHMPVSIMYKWEGLGKAMVNYSVKESHQNTLWQ